MDSENTVDDRDNFLSCISHPERRRQPACLSVSGQTGLQMNRRTLPLKTEGQFGDGHGHVLPTYLPSFHLTYLHTFLPSFLPTYLRKESRSIRKCVADREESSAPLDCFFLYTLRIELAVSSS